MDEAETDCASCELEGFGVLLKPDGKGGLERVRVGKHLGDELLAIVGEPGACRLEDVGHPGHYAGKVVDMMAKVGDEQRHHAEYHAAADERDEDQSKRPRRRSGHAPRERLRKAVEDEIEHEAADDRRHEMPA